VLLDAGSPVMVRRGGIVDLGEMFENEDGRRDVVMGADSYGAGGARGCGRAGIVI